MPTCSGACVGHLHIPDPCRPRATSVCCRAAAAHSLLCPPQLFCTIKTMPVLAESAQCRTASHLDDHERPPLAVGTMDVHLLTCQLIGNG